MDQKWNDFLSYCWINSGNVQRYDKKSFYFKNARLTEILQAVICQILWLYYYIPIVKPFLDIKMSIFEEYGAFKLCMFCV